jgi:branched-chain amino acid transport system substrate-binding protein
MKKIIFVSFIAIALAISFTVPAQAEKPIKIGFIHSLSGGVGQVYGVPDLAGVKIAVEEINAAGGILGRKLEVISRDDKLKPEVGVREAKDLILNEKVDWIQGTVSSAVALAISSYCKAEKVIFLVSVSQSAAITGEKGHRYVFRMCTNTTNYARSMANAAAKNWGGKKVFIIGPDYEYGHRCKADFMEAYTKLVPGAEVVGELWPKLGNKDYTPYITKIMATDLDFVYCSLYGGDLLSFTKTACPFGYFDKIKHCGQDWGNMEGLSSMTKSCYPKGVLGGSHYPWWQLDNAKSNAFYPKFKKETGMDAGLGAAAGYTIVYAMKQAIEKAGAVDTEKDVDALAGSVVDSVVGPLKIRACDHQAMWPFWVGQVAFTDAFPWPHVTNAVAMDPPEKGYRSCEEIKAARAAEK